MSDNERLLGALQEFKKSQVEANRINREEHLIMMAAIEKVNQWQWKIDGAKMLVVAIVGAIAGFFGGR